nr:hypothetical protein [Candidatus Sigynarchaeota archaeon]
MGFKETIIKGAKDLVDNMAALPSFFAKKNPRLTEDEQMRLEKKARLLFKESIMKMRGKQWQQSLQTLEGAKKLCIELDWQEGMIHADKIRDMVALKKENEEREQRERSAKERFDKKTRERTQREDAEQQRLDQLHKLDDDRVQKLKKLIKVSERVEIARISDILDVDEKIVWKNIVDWADQFGFKIAGKEIVFGKGNM